MTRREEWIRLVAAALAAGARSDAARLTADEMQREADERHASTELHFAAAAAWSAVAVSSGVGAAALKKEGE